MERFAGLDREGIVAGRRDGAHPRINFGCEAAEDLAGDALYGRTGGQIQRFMKTLAKKLGYKSVHLSRNRDSSGFNLFAEREMADPNQWSESKKEYNRMIPIIRKVVRALCKKKKAGTVSTPPPQVVNFGLSVLSGQRDGDPSVWRLSLNFHYKEGHYVTPIQYL